MNLAQPHYTNILHLDAQLAALEREVLDAQQKYGFTITEDMVVAAENNQDEDVEEKPQTFKPPIKPDAHPAPSVASVSGAQQSSNKKSKRASLINSSLNAKSVHSQRYTNLITTRVEKPQSVQKAAQISQKWTETFRDKPDLHAFYDTDVYRPTHVDASDLQTIADFSTDYTHFNSYMDNFALTFSKLQAQ